MPVVKDQLDEWRATAVEQWGDGRIVDAGFVDAWIWFWHHLYAEFQHQGFDFRGASFKLEGEGCLLVLKITREGVPEVVFCSSSDPTHCVQKLRRLLRSGEARFYPDKYA